MRTIGSISILGVCSVTLAACTAQGGDGAGRSSRLQADRADQPAKVIKRGDEQTDWPTAFRFAERRFATNPLPVPAEKTELAFGPMDLTTSVGNGPLRIDLPPGKPGGDFLKR